MSEKQVKWLNECACCKHNSVCMYGLQTQEEARTKALQRDTLSRTHLK